MSNNPLPERLLYEEKEFIIRLDKIKRGNSHSGMMGEETELTWIELLDKYLPNRYKVGGGKIFDHKGSTSNQIDLMIYDSYYTPNISCSTNATHGYTTMARVPIESVFAVFEVKQNISKNHLDYAEDKHSSVICLKRTSKEIKTLQGSRIRKKNKDFRIIYGLLAKEAGWKDGLKSKKFSDLIIDYKSIDFVITAQDGFYDSSLEKPCCEEFSLFKALFRLFSRLSEMGNPPAIDSKKYLEILG